MKQVGKKILSAGLAILSLAACTKELPYKEKFKDEARSRDTIDTKSEHLYSASVMGISRSSSDALPFSAGENKRVKLQWTKTSLRVVEIEQDARYQGNKTNDKLVLEIPVDYVDYQCAKDKYGECTNTEEEADVNYEAKKFFKFKDDGIKSAQLEPLPLLSKQVQKTIDSDDEGDEAGKKQASNKTVKSQKNNVPQNAEGGDDGGGDNFCYHEVATRILKIDVEPTAINIDIERAFKVNPYCMTSGATADSNVTGVFHYSMVKASSILSQDFKPVAYPEKDSRTFGFFATERNVLDASNNATQTGKQILMNHWNPNRDEIVYYLSDEFAKPENAKIRELTYKTVDNINSGLAKAGVRFRLNLKDPAGKNPGDIRNSMIILVEDPVASSVIGYGPQTEDPMTGEIISARTVMFLGTIKKYIKYTYDDIVRTNRRELQKSQAPAATPAPAPQNKTQTPEKTKKMIAALTSEARPTIYSTQRYKSKVHKRHSKLANLAVLEQNLRSVKDYQSRKNRIYDNSLEGRFRYLQEAKNCAYGLNNEFSVGSISPSLAKKFPADAKPWESLSESEKQHVIDIILPEIWVPTLIHEMGHNLGLRHNFQGSEDKENFYSEAELQAMGIDHEMPFSTVMEYGDDLKALTVLGKYDIAALRFGYLRKVETADGNVQSVDGTLDKMLKTASKDEKTGQEIPALKLKEYGYCTDEGTGINAGCRRFDLGTTYTDIAKNLIESYKERYESRNFRRDRENFSLIGDIDAMRGVQSTFMEMRLMQEVYSRLEDLESIPEDSPFWKNNPKLATMFKDLKQASVLVGQFFMEVLNTPDLTCVLVEKTDTKQENIIAEPLAQILPDSITCKDLNKLNSDTFPYIAIGEFGKLFNSKKDPLSDNPYADQIDVRGYWIDKVVAGKMLFKRTFNISSLDDSTTNYTDREEISGDLAELIKKLMLNRSSGTYEVKMFDGSEIQLTAPIETFQTHVIDKPILPILARILGLPNRAVNFNELLVNQAVDMTLGSGHEIDGQDFATALQIQRTSTISSTKTDGLLTYNVGNQTVVASPDNELGYEALAMYVMTSSMDQSKPEEIKAVLEARKKDPKATAPAGELAPGIKAAWTVDVGTLNAYVNGVRTSEFYNQVLNYLPSF